MGLRIRTILVLAFTLHIIVFAIAILAAPDGHRFESADTPKYIAPALGLIANSAYAPIGSAIPEIRLVPGYPVFLIPGILMGHVAVVTVLIQIVLGCATVFLVFQTALRLFRRTAIAAGAALAYAVDPYAIIYANQLLTECLFLFLMMMFLSELLKYFHTFLKAHCHFSSVAECFCVCKANISISPGHYRPRVAWLGV